MVPFSNAFRNSRSSKKFSPRVALVTGLVFVVGGLGASWSVLAGIVPSGIVWLAPVLESPADAPPKQNDEPTLPDEEQRAVNLLMYRDRDRERLLYHAQSHLEQGDLTTALDHLQQILDLEEDLFVWRKSDGQLVSLRSEASRLIQNLDAFGLASYERMVAADAEVLLKNARTKWSPLLFETVARRYFHTDQGFRATHWCATRWFDHGYYELAAHAWESLESHPLHAKKVTKVMRAKRELARNRAAKGFPSEAPLVRVADNHLFAVNTTGPRLDVIPRIAADVEPRRSASWTLFQGGWDRTESAAATTPFLNPDWVASFGDQKAYTLTKAIELWEEKQGKALQSLATALFPVVVNEQVVFRDFEGIRAVNLKTGEPVWSYPCQTSLRLEMNSLDQRLGAGGVHSSRASSYVQVQAAYAANSVLGQLSSDGERVYFVDQMVLDSASEYPTSEESPTKSFDPRKSNQLIAVAMEAANDTAVRPQWVLGGFGPTQSTDSALTGHFFRGPPLPIDGRLYVVTEHANQLNLVALEAETGKLLWKQGIAFAEESFEIDQDRYPLACPIAFSDGVLVCPTQTGLLVGVDAMSGVLLWSYCYSEELYDSDNRGWRDRYRKSWGTPGFPDAPKIRGRHVVLLPRQSEDIHCLDLRTGRRLWKTSRDDAEYIGAVTGELVFVVGQRYCRGLSLESGEEEWSARFGMPAGQGIFAGHQYLLPLESGRVVTVDLRSGREVGLSGWRKRNHFAKALPEAASELPKGWRTGNLIPAGDQILACGTTGIVAFPQTGELLNRKLRNRLIDAPEDVPTRLLAAELQMNLGQLAEAKTNLETALLPGKSQEHIAHGEFLLRELLFRQLEAEPDFALPILDELEDLVATPADRARFLMRKADYQLRTGNPIGAFESAQALNLLDYEGQLPWPRNPEHTISSRSYTGGLMQRIRRELNASQLAQLQQWIEAECQRATTHSTAAQMERFMALYDAWPESAFLRQRLAETARSQGQFQRAEFLWLKNRQSADPVVVATANRHLMELWTQLGLYSEAAVLAEELVSPKFRDVPLRGNQTPAQVLAKIPPESLLAEAMRNRQLPELPTHRVAITEERWTSTENDLIDAFGQYRREFSLEPGSSYQLLDKGWVIEEGDEPETRVAVIDRQAGLIHGKVRIPLRNSFPSLSKGAHVGHFFPVGSTNRMTGISLLEIDKEKPLWAARLGDEAAHQHILRVGPAGPDYCTFQGPRELVMLDPSSGKTLWKRTDIDPASGLVSDPYAGMFGDCDVLVVFGSNRSSYSVYQTSTGEELHHGELDVDTGQIRRIFGSKLFYIANKPEGRRMRIWDFKDNRLIFDKLAGPRIHTALTPDQELVLLIPPQECKDDDEDASEQPSRLQILDVINEKVLLDLSVPAVDLKNLNYVRAFRHGGRFYVNLQRTVQMPVERLFSYYASDSFPPVENIQGDLLAVDPETGNVLWKRTLPQRSILHMPHIRLPFLVMMSRVRDRWQGGKQGLLVEVLDAETGETIAQKDNIFSDRVVNLAYDKDKGWLDLNGLKTRVRLKFGPAIARVPSVEEPL